MRLRDGRYYAVAGDGTQWAALNDGVSHTTARTNKGGANYMELDFGEGGRRMNRVRVVHHRADMERVNGVTLRAMDGSRGVMFEYVFQGIRDDSAEVVDVDMFGRVRCGW